MGLCRVGVLVNGDRTFHQAGGGWVCGMEALGALLKDSTPIVAMQPGPWKKGVYPCVDASCVGAEAHS